MRVPWRIDPSGLTVLAENLYTERLVVHLLQAEEALRKTVSVQDLYRNVRAMQMAGAIPPEAELGYTASEVSQSHKVHVRKRTYVLEDDIQRFMLQLHGVPDMKVRLNLDEDGKAYLMNAQEGCSDAELARSNALLDLHRDILTREYVLRPAVRQAAFFLRNNIQREGYAIGDTVDVTISLVPFSQDKIVFSQPRNAVTIASLLEKARNIGRDYLVFFSGSIT